MPRYLLSFAFYAVLILSLPVSAQQQQSAARPQTPRQALIEIVTKGAEGITRHLTVEVQQLLAKSNNKAALGVLTGFSSMKPEKGMQFFDSGPILFAYTDPAQHTKFEVRVENDDMAGDQDDLQLSLHEFRDGQEQESDLGFMSPRLSVSLKQQQSIWRLNKISVGADFPVGDPAFFEKTFLKVADGRATGLGVVAGAASNDAKANNEAPHAMPPEQLLTLLGFAETTFARQHPDKGFTCSLTELAEAGKTMGVDGQVSTGVTNGYRIRLSGCEGKPAGSFQITAEPVVAAAGAKAYCTDATQNVRSSDDGQGSSCLAFGKVSHQMLDGGVDQVHVVVHPSTDK